MSRSHGAREMGRAKDAQFMHAHGEVAGVQGRNGKRGRGDGKGEGGRGARFNGLALEVKELLLDGDEGLPVESFNA